MNKKSFLLCIILTEIYCPVWANSLSLQCTILDKNHLPQTTFSANETAIFKINGTVDSDAKDYRIDFKVSAKAIINKFKIPLQLNESFNVPVRGAKNPFIINEERTLKLPPIQGELALNIRASFADNQTLSAVCDNTLTIK